MRTVRLWQRLFALAGGSIVVAGAITAGAATAVGAPMAGGHALSGDWPMHHGPHGNFLPARSGATLVDDLSQARLVWVSEDDDLGVAKTPVSGFPLYVTREGRGHFGSCASPIVADGKVFYTSFRPSGDVYPPDVEKKFEEKGLPFPKEEFLIAADDLVGAIDARTGRTLWKAVEAGKGLSRPQIKRQGYGPAPAYHEGRVFSLGTTGRLYCYNATTGKRLWEKNIGATHEKTEQLKKKLLAERKVPPRLPWLSSLVVAEGVLVVPLFDGNDMTLRGVNVENGERLWEAPEAISQWATPSVYRHNGREYLLAATIGGVLRMIDPRNGQALWTVTGLGPNYTSLAPSESHVLVNVVPKPPNSRERIHGLLAAYRISPEGAERAWTMPNEERYYFQTWFDSAARRRYLLRDGLVYYQSYGPDKEEHRRFVILREATGEILFESKDGPNVGMMMLCEDRLINIPDPVHSDRLTMEMYTADPGDFRKLSGPWKPPHRSTTGYEVVMEIPYVDGRIFMRTEAGRVRCYDLRKAD